MQQRLLVFILIFSFGITAGNKTVAQNLDIPVNLQTGTAQVSLPLHTLNEPGITHTISLNYAANGAQLGDGGYKNHAAGKVRLGTGWVVNLAGSIKRTRRHKPDETTTKGWLEGNNGLFVKNFTPATGAAARASLNDCTGDLTDYNALNINADLEPDLFSFDFGSFSGKFVFDHVNDGNGLRPIRTIPFQDLKIEYTILPFSNGKPRRISEFKITASDGTIYKFGQARYEANSMIAGMFGVPYFYANEYFNLDVGCNVEWGLTEIISPKGGKITFTYNSSDFFTNWQSRINSEVPFYINLWDTNNPYWLAEDFTADYSSSVLELTGITSTKEQILISSSSSSDFGIQVSEAGNNYELIKQIRFFNPEVTTSDGQTRRFLRSVQEFSDCFSIAAYKFDYVGVDFESLTTALPGTDSKAKDFWGYYNASADTSLIPKIYVYPSLHGAERYRLFPIPNHNVTNEPLIMEGASRQPHDVAVSSGTLNQITYPTRGHVRLYYEPNQFYDPVANATFAGAGIRVKKIVQHDGLDYNRDIVKEYAYSNGKLIYRPVFTLPLAVNYGSDYRNAVARSLVNLAPNDHDDNGVIYTNVTEKQSGKGRIEYTFTTPGISNQNTSDYSAPYNFYTTVTKVARNATNFMPGYCGPLGIWEEGTMIYPFPPNTNYEFERGLLTYKKVYNERNHLLQEVQYQHTRLHPDTNPVVVKGIASEYIYGSDFFVYGHYNLLTNVGKLISEEKQTNYDPNALTRKIEETTNYFYEASNHKMLTRVTNTKGSASPTYQTRFKYVKDFTAASPADEATTAIQKMQQKFMHGLMVETISSVIPAGGGTEKITGASLKKYKAFTFANVPDPETLVAPRELLLPSQDLGLSLLSPVTNATFAEASTASNSFAQDSKYSIIKNYVSYGPMGNATELNNNRKVTQGFIYDNTNFYPLVEMVNAKPSQVVFGMPHSSSLETDSRHVGNKAIQLTATTSLSKTGIERGIGDYYTVSVWVKATGSGVLTANLCDNITCKTASLNYSNTYGKWQYIQAKINTANYPVLTGNSLSFELVNSTAVTLDYDILLYPSLVDLKYTAYNKYGKLAELNSKGQGVNYEYDMFGRTNLTRDQDDNILQRITYTYDFSQTKDPYITHGGNQIYQATSFSVEDCQNGNTYDWNFGDGTGTITNGGSSLNHTYYQTGEYIVTLTEKHSDNTTYTFTKKVKMIKKVGIELCIIGYTRYNPCDSNDTPTEGNCMTGTNYGGFNVYTPVVSEYQNGNPVKMVYKWEKARVTNDEKRKFYLLGYTENPNPEVELNHQQGEYIILRCTAIPVDGPADLVPNTAEVIIDYRCYQN